VVTAPARLDRVLSPHELEAALRELGAARYHDRHPFHRRLEAGSLDRGQVQAWALNRYLYQAMIPQKDAAIVARCEDRALRRAWRQRIVDHDGDDVPAGDATGRAGGIERWLRLTSGLGLDPELVVSGRAALPAVRFAVEAYLHFVRERSLLEAVASSLTELFAPKTIASRTSAMLRHYDFVSKDALIYFEARLEQAPRDVGFALDHVKREARTVETQHAVLGAMAFKCDVLWAQLDALHHAYVEPRHVPPGAFEPGAS
jgi:pyrroloquinoline-quinone synthase